VGVRSNWSSRFPSIGPYPSGGIVIINAHTQKVIRSGQNWAMAHFSRSLKRGARRFESQSDAVNLGHVAMEFSRRR